MTKTLPGRDGLLDGNSLSSGVIYVSSLKKVFLLNLFRLFLTFCHSIGVTYHNYSNFIYRVLIFQLLPFNSKFIEMFTFFRHFKQYISTLCH